MNSQLTPQRIAQIIAAGENAPGADQIKRRLEILAAEKTEILNRIDRELLALESVSEQIKRGTEQLENARIFDAVIYPTFIGLAEEAKCSNF